MKEKENVESKKYKQCDINKKKKKAKNFNGNGDGSMRRGYSHINMYH
jgi:hypothetical protein